MSVGRVFVRTVDQEMLTCRQKLQQQGLLWRPEGALHRERCLPGPRSAVGTAPLGCPPLYATI